MIDLSSQLYFPNGSWFLYVLLTENNYYYVGMTLYPKERITNHFEGNGANFTKKNKPIEVVELYCLNLEDRELAYKQETLKAKEYRNLHGSDKAVGGKHHTLKIKKRLNESIKREH